jgi:hypothetical protein
MKMSLLNWTPDLAVVIHVHVYNCLYNKSLVDLKYLKLNIHTTELL